VTPIVGWAEPPLTFKPDPHEVADVFEVPLAFLLDAGNHRYESAFYKGRMRKYWAMRTASASSGAPPPGCWSPPPHPHPASRPAHRLLKGWNFRGARGNRR